ncbi:MAG: hypothetical protein ABI586_09430, partial [Candidatus Nanopelagicales bacterium]
MTDQPGDTQSSAVLPPVTTGEVVLVASAHPPAAMADAILGVVAISLETLRAGFAGRLPKQSVPIDAALEVSWQVWSRSARTFEMAGRAAAPIGRFFVDPPMLPVAMRPVTLVNGAATSWRARLPHTLAATAQLRDTVVPSVLDQIVTSINLTELVLRRVDLARVVSSALKQLDLTDIVVEQVDLDRVANAVLDRVDLDKVARERMDLMALAAYVIEGIDLPEIIRESTGSVASETVRSVRM